MSEMIYDLIVIGSGSVGAAAGYYATIAGLKVLMIDNGHPPHDEGSHHGETRLIRHAYFEGEYYVPLVLRAQHLFNQLEIDCGERIMHRCGVLYFAPKNSEIIEKMTFAAQHHKLNLIQLSPDEVMTKWPQINMPEDYIGLYETESGYLKCEKAIRNWIQLAKNSGCVQLFDCTVTGVATENDVQRVETDQGNYLGRKILFSAGTWIKKILPNVPIQPLRKVFSWHQADNCYGEKDSYPGFIGVFRDGSNYYGFPANDNALKIGKHNGGQPINDKEERTPFGTHADDQNEVSDFLRQFFPSIGELVYGKSCTYDMTADGNFIIDTQPGEPNRLIISGLSGHGFKFSSVLGEIATTFAQNKPSPFDLSHFSLARFGKTK